MPNTAYIYDAVRTPRSKGKPGGSLHEVKPISLVTTLIDAMKERNPTLDPNGIDDLVLGCVSPVADQGACIAKTAAVEEKLRARAGSTPVTTSSVATACPRR